MVQTRSQARKAAMATARTTLEHLVPPDQQVKGRERKHWVYWAEDHALVLVRAAKNKWGLVLIDDKGAVAMGQYVKHRIHPHRCGFDGRHFYWDGYLGQSWDFIKAKSIAPYFTAVEPPTIVDGHGFDAEGHSIGRNGWAQMAGGAHECMYDLTTLQFERLPPPPGYPKYK